MDAFPSMLTHIQQLLTPTTATGLCVGLVGFITSLIVIPFVLTKLAPRFSAPREKQLHQTHRAPVPRFGGIAFVVAFAIIAPVAFIFLGCAEHNLKPRLTVTLTALAMFGLGLWDDISPLGARKKLVGQILVALTAYYFGVRIDILKNPLSPDVYVLGVWSLPATVFWLVALTNLINLVDGIDGLAGGISLMLMCLLIYVGFHGHSFSFYVALGMAGALVGFLNFNFPPARIYMGDGGAYFLGYLIGALAIQNSNKGTIAAALIAPIIALALPILDVSVSIVRRGLKGLPIFRPDQRHIHHRLLQAGLSSRRAVLTLYGISLVFLVIGFVAFSSSGKLIPILFGCVFLVLLMVAPSLGLIKNWLTVGTALGSSLDMRKEVQYALLLRNWLEMEAERTESVDHLWTDLKFMARKIGFTEMSMSVGTDKRSWNTDAVDAAGGAHSAQHELQINDQVVRLQFRARKEDMSLKLFSILSELMAEAWQHASVRWRESRNLPFTFSPPANEPRAEHHVVPITDSLSA